MGISKRVNIPMKIPWNPHVLIVNHHLSGAKRREFSGIHWLTINNPSNPKPSIPCVKRTSKLLTHENPWQIPVKIHVLIVNLVNLTERFPHENPWTPI